MTVAAVLVGKLNSSLINQPVYCRLIVAWLAPTLALGLPPPLSAAQALNLQTLEPETGPGGGSPSPLQPPPAWGPSPLPLYPPPFWIHQAVPRMPTQSSPAKQPCWMSEDCCDPPSLPVLPMSIAIYFQGSGEISLLYNMHILAQDKGF